MEVDDDAVWVLIDVDLNLEGLGSGQIVGGEVVLLVFVVGNRGNDWNIVEQFGWLFVDGLDSQGIVSLTVGVRTRDGSIVSSLSNHASTDYDGTVSISTGCLDCSAVE